MSAAPILREEFTSVPSAAEIRDFGWGGFAACLKVDPETMHPDRYDRVGNARAKDVCRSCPVIEQCFKDGGDSEFGVWGGTTELERLALREGPEARARRAKAAERQQRYRQAQKRG